MNDKNSTKSFPVVWPHKPDHRHLVESFTHDFEEYQRRHNRGDDAWKRNNRDFFRGMVRRCRDLASYAWYFQRTPTGVTEWLQPGAQWCEQWIELCGDHTPSVAAYDRVFSMGLLGGSSTVRHWVANRKDTSGFADGITGAELSEQWGRALIALSRGDTDWVRTIANRMDELCTNTKSSPDAVDAFSGLPQLMRSVIGEGDIAKAVAERNTIYTEKYLRSFGPDRARTPEVFVDWDALVVTAFAPDYKVTVPSSLYLPVESVVPFR